MINVILKFIKYKVVKNSRKIILSKIISNIIIKKFKNKISILDYGAGHEPDVVLSIYKELKKNRFKKILINAVDVYKKKDIQKLKKNTHIKFYSIQNFKKLNKKYDITLINDTLHHIGIEDEKNIISLLKLLKKRSKYLIIKDHFEEGLISNFLLRLMDYIGNRYNNVNVPKKYFTKKGFQKILNLVGLKIDYKVINQRYYNKVFLFMSSPNLHFLYLLK
jgi:hypothetical protein